MSQINENTRNQVLLCKMLMDNLYQDIENHNSYFAFDRPKQDITKLRLELNRLRKMLQ